MARARNRRGGRIRPTGRRGYINARNLAEQGILIMMIKLLELIYYKVTP
jgi:hypothetical protein